MKKSERLNQELIFLRDKTSFQLKDLMTAFGISKRTALRDIEELESLGLAFYTEPGRNGGYRLLKQDLLVPVHFSINDLTAILYALGALNQLVTTPFDKSYHQLFDKIWAQLSASKQERVKQALSVIHYYNVPSINAPNYLSDLLEAILEEQILGVDYDQYGPEHKLLRFYDLFYREGVWFLHGYDCIAATWVIYRADCVTGLAPQSHLDCLPRPQLSESLEQFQTAFQNTPFRCWLTDFGKELFLKNHFENMTLEKIEGRYAIVGAYNPSELHYMIHYLLEFGQHITIAFPQTLKERYVGALKELLSRYSMDDN